MIGPGDPIKAFEPLWGSWYAREVLGEGGYGRVYCIERNDTGGTFLSACKHITIPRNESEIANARAMGMDGASLSAYFETMARSIINEIVIMHELRGEANIVAYEDHMVAHVPGRLRWDIFIRMELLIPLTAYMKDNYLPPDEVRRLGTEICTALETCAAHNIIHRDIKDANVFLNSRGSFKLGDFGIAREVRRDSLSMSMRGTPAYIAPEIYNGQRYDRTVDFYSLGILMYKLLNGGRYPFLPPAPQPFTPEQSETSFIRRVRGEPIPPPACGDAALCAAVMMACDFNPGERFDNAAAMKKALQFRG